MPVAHELAPTEPAGETAVAPPSNPIPAPCGQSTPFSRCWPAYAALWAANRRLTWETPEKPKEQSSSFSGVSVRGGCAGAFPLPGKTEARCGLAPKKNRVRARRGEERDTVRDLPGAAALEKPRSRAQLFKRFCAKGDACALRLLTPFPRAAGRLKRPFGPQTAG